ncbi:MAG: type IV pilus secretin PilQ [Nitrospirales bacterium]|nr:type IV pilus secretin PilQ [Nitrospirales bacterium]
MKILYPKHHRVFAFYVLLCLCILFPGQGLTLEREAGAQEITDIAIRDNAIIIKADSPFQYTLSNPSDPFRPVLEIAGVGLGRFREKIYAGTGGVTEITPSESQSLSGARLDILLQSPAVIVSEKKDNTLTLRLADLSPEGASQPLPSGVSPANAKRVTSVVFDKTDDGIELILKGDGNMPEPFLTETDGGLVLDIPGVALKSALPLKMLSPVRALRYKDLGDRMRLLVETIGKVEYDAFALDDEVVLAISLSEARNREVQGLSAKSTTGKDLISLDFQDADIVPILRLLVDVGGYNIVIHPDVKGAITMKLLNVPWDQAMEIILRTFNLEKIVEGNVIRITTLKAFQEEKKAIAETREVFGTAEPVETRVFILNYAEVEKIKDSIANAKILSPRGNVSFDTRTKSIVVKDVSSVLSELEKLVAVLDKPTSQVSIETRIVEINNTMARSLGVEWGFLWDPDGGRAIGGSVGSFIPGGLTGSTVTSFPASTTSTPVAPTALTFGYLNAAKTLGLDLRLSAIADTGRGKIISNPKVVTTDNQKARIIQGETIPYGELTPSTTAGGMSTISTKFKDVTLNIEVTPKISNDGTISMNVVTSKEELVSMDPIANGVIAPHTTKIEGTTTVLVKDGDTMVIGGIYRNGRRDNTSGVPGLMDIPFLGWLFKKTTVEDDTREVLIFITPRLIKQ